MTAILIENALAETGVTARQDYGDATPDQATGWEATNALAPSVNTSWRTNDTKAGNTQLLTRLPKTRSILGVAAVEDNMGRSGLWRATADDEYAIRPVWTSDGATAHGQTAATIPTVADMTLLMRLWLNPAGTNGNTLFTRVLHCSNVAGTRFELLIRPGSVIFPFQLYGTVNNWDVNTSTSPTVIKADGTVVNLAVRYSNSDQLFEVLSSGVVVGSITASAAWSDNGAERLTISALDTLSAGTLSAITWQDIRYVGRRLSDAEIAAYRAEIQNGTERDLNGSWHFLSGTTTVADSTGTSAITLTSGVWSERINPFPLWDTGVLEAREQWSHRQALRIKPGTRVTSPSLGDAPRSITIAGLIQINPEDPLVTGFAAWFGPSIGSTEVALVTLATGQIQGRSTRGPLVAINSAAINDGLLRRWRVVLDGRTNLLSFYVGLGSAAEALQGTVAVSGFGTLATCLLGIGSTFSTESTALLSDVRVYSEIRLEADDDLTADIGTADYHLLAHVRADGSILDQVDQTRSYTTAALTYEEISQTTTRTLAAADKRRVDAAADPYARYHRKVAAALPAAVEATEIFWQFWDPSNADGYLEVAVLAAWGGMRPTEARAWGGDREHITPPLKQSPDGVAYLERGYNADRLRISLNLLSPSEAAELEARLRQRPDTLVAIVPDESVALVGAHLIQQRAIVGVLKPGYSWSDPDATVTRVTLEIEETRRLR